MAPESARTARNSRPARVKIHFPIGFVQAGFVDVEGIGVLHQELARPHDTEARPDLVAELGLDLVKGHRQLLVAA